MYYDSEALYILSCTDAQAKIVAINNLIDVLLATVLLSVGTADTQEYMLNDGQTVIKKVYRSAGEVTDTVSKLRIMRQLYINDINPRQRRLVGAENLIIGRRFK